MKGDKSQSKKEALKGTHKSQAFAENAQSTKTPSLEPVLICPKCHAVYFDKHWHSSEALYEMHAAGGKIVRELCPEDKAGHAEINYEGEVLLKNIPHGNILEIAEQARNIGKRAEKRDPEDKIIKIEIQKNSIRILTTENQLAISIAKQIDRARKGGQLEIKWSKGEPVARAVWTHK